MEFTSDVKNGAPEISPKLKMDFLISLFLWICSDSRANVLYIYISTWIIENKRYGIICNYLSNTISEIKEM